MMGWMLRSIRKKTRGKIGWRVTLAVCLCLFFIAVSNAGAGQVEPNKDGAIGGKAWCDLNEDGKRQNTETYLPGVSVTLKKISPSGGYHYVASTTTNAKGRYKFKDIPLGTYAVLFDPNDLSYTVPNVGNDKRDSDVTGTLHGGGLTDPVHLDAHDPTNYSTDAGYVGCDTPEPPMDGAIGGRAWCDVNHDGQRQEDELILPDVGVTLKKVLANGHQEIAATTTTDAQGRYKFEQLPRGTYVVAFDDNGASFTVADDADDCADSDVIDQSGGKGITDEILLDADHPASPCTDAGYLGDCVPTDGVIGGKAWCDLNEDGQRQDSDTLLPDVSVTLKRQLPGGQLEDVATITTDANGSYSFKDLPLGTYVVAWEDNDLAYTVANAAGDCVDSDVAAQQGGEGLTDPIVLDADAPASTCTDAGYVGCDTTGPCIEITDHPNWLIYDKYRKLLVFGTWISWSQLEALGVDLPHQYDRANDDFNNSMSVVEGNFTEFREELTNLGAKWVRLEPEGSWSYLKIRINAPTSGPNWRVDNFNHDYVKQLPPTLKFTLKIVQHGQEQEICFDIPYHFTQQRISSPIALDTDGSGAVERITGEFAFDFIGNGEPVKATEWFAPTEGILVDTRIPGPMTGAHLFGDMGGRYADGYAKLATLDADADGAVSGAELAGLSIWTDVNSNAMADAGEISSLTAHQIVRLSTSHIGYVSTVMLANGDTMVAEDLWFPVILPPAAPVAAPMVSIKTLAFGLGGFFLLALLIMAARRSRQVSVPEAA